ncbi:MAG: hypothetical protein IKA71_00765 [Lentisphaeria bacterium]|nr:hypothetical protein [Lentisphaeria bacterium]
MNERVSDIYEKTRNGFYRRYRREQIPAETIAGFYHSMPPYMAVAKALKTILQLETPVIIPGEKFYFTRTLRGNAIPPPEAGRRVENLTPDWEILLRDGVEKRLELIRAQLEKPDPDPESIEFLLSAHEMLSDVITFAGRYADAADAAGNKEAAKMLHKIPASPPENMHEALQAIFFMFSILHLTGCTLQGFGRMDQYLYPFYQHDLDSGLLTRQEAGELLEEFFIMLNRENDLYGMLQRGDDGESLMLGGCKTDGSDAVNDLTLLILETAEKTAMINPKINLRVNTATAEHILRAGLRLAKRGLGFPQYCNDEVVIPALVKFGYPLEAARDYTVAACWEFVVKDGRDIPNCASVNLALAADNAIRTAMREKQSFEQLLENVKAAIRQQVPRPFPKLLPNPLFSAFSGKCLERARDIHDGGGTHYHYGIHGCASSTAADSLAAVKKLVFDDKKIAPEILLAALENNFDGYQEVRQLLQTAPKTGNDEQLSNAMLNFIFNAFADAIAEVPPDARGGRIRPGTGAAQNYVMMTQFPDHPYYLRATADGRKEGEFFSSSLSPAPGVRANGILSIFRTYGKLPYEKLCNGGPITLELSPAYFRNPDALDRGIQIIRAFVLSGCQQLQMNLLDRETLLDAQKNPEKHRDLIVRVWGWSGYFTELDKAFQDQIIAREAYGA